MRKLHLVVVSQERQLLDTEVTQITVTTSEGEVTILPGHIPLVTKLMTGELRFVTSDRSDSIVVSRGFMTVSPGNQVTIMADTAVHAREISEQKAEEAVHAAHETLRLSADQRERMMAEAALRRALLEIKIAERSKRSRV